MGTGNQESGQAPDEDEMQDAVDRHPASRAEGTVSGSRIQGSTESVVALRRIGQQADEVLASHPEAQTIEHDGATVGFTSPVNPEEPTSHPDYDDPKMLWPPDDGHERGYN